MPEGGDRMVTMIHPAADRQQLVAALLLVNADAKACRDKRPGVVAADEAHGEIDRLLDALVGA